MGNDSTNSLIVRPYIKIVTPIQLPITSLPPWARENRYDQGKKTHPPSPNNENLCETSISNS